MKRKKQSEQAEPAAPAQAAAAGAPVPERLVDGVPVRTYRGASLSEIAPRIRAELGESAMILRQREGVTGGIGGFFARRMVEVDVAVLDVPGQPVAPQRSAGGGRIDVSDGPSVGPGGQVDLIAQAEAALTSPDPQPTVPFSAIAEQHGFAPGLDAPTTPAGASVHQPITQQTGPAPGANPYSTLPPDPATPAPHFTVGAPSAEDSAGVEAALAADQARQRAERQAHQAGGMAPSVPSWPVVPAPHAAPSPAPIAEPAAPFIQPAPPSPGYVAQPQTAAESPYIPHTLDPPHAPDLPLGAPSLPAPPQAPAPDPVHDDALFDAGRAGADAAPVAQGSGTFEERLRGAGLTGSHASLAGDPVAQLAPLHGALLRRGLPDQIASPVVDDTLLHRISLQPDRPVRELLASELARRIPTAPLAGRAGQAVAFVGSSGAGKTRAIARLAAAYGAANQVPVACVTLQDSGADGLLAAALAPFGIAVHAAPDAPRALDRITALRRQALVLIDTPGVSPGDQESVERLGVTLSLLELDQVALCLPVVLAAPIARRVLRAMQPLGPSLLVATHADEADLLGGVVAVSIDRRVPIAYVSAGAGRGGIVGADAHQIASELTGTAPAVMPAPRPLAGARPTPSTSLDREPIALVPREREPEPDPHAVPGPTVDVAAGPGHLAAPWVVSSLRSPKRRR